MLSDLITKGNYGDLKRTAENRAKWTEWFQTTSEDTENHKK